MTDDTEPLDPDIRSMLETALPMTAVPEPLRDRILSKVEARIALRPAGDAAFRPSHAEPVGPRGGSAWIASHPWLAVGAALVVGGAFGAAVKSASQGERVVYVARGGLSRHADDLRSARQRARPAYRKRDRTG
jgi:hypothetical protein